jgi:hypothetical protein
VYLCPMRFSGSRKKEGEEGEGEGGVALVACREGIGVWVYRCMGVGLIGC